MAYQKKYSYADRLDYFNKRYKHLKAKSHLDKKEYGQMMYAKGYCDVARGDYDENLAWDNQAYGDGWLNSAKAQTKARSFKF